jgi:hypothetical protein
MACGIIVITYEYPSTKGIENHRILAEPNISAILDTKARIIEAIARYLGQE